MHLIIDFARSIGAATPLLDVTSAIFHQAADQGLEDWDAAAVHAVIEEMNPPLDGDC